MKRFPGTPQRGGRNHRTVILTPEQEQWLRDNYPTTENARLARAMNCSIESMRAYARRLGIKEKSEAGWRDIRKRQVKKALKTNNRNGCYDRKRGHPVSEATLEGNRKRWADIRAGLRELPQETAKRRDPDAWQASLKKRSENRKKLIEQEKRRLIYGLERKTTLKTVVMTPYTCSQTHHRCNALKRGYLLDQDCSEGQPGRYVIYYDDETQRSSKFEANCIADGFRFERDA